MQQNLRDSGPLSFELIEMPLPLSKPTLKSFVSQFRCWVAPSLLKLTQFFQIRNQSFSLENKKRLITLILFHHNNSVIEHNSCMHV